MQNTWLENRIIKKIILSFQNLTEWIFAGNFIFNGNDPSEVHPTRNNPDGIVKATGTQSISVGRSSISSGRRSISAGDSSGSGGYTYSSEASGKGAFALNGALASGDGSIAFGLCGSSDNYDDESSMTYRRSVVSGVNSFCIGNTCKVHAPYSMVLGGQYNRIKSNAACSLAAGALNDLDTAYTFVFGTRLLAKRTNQMCVGQDNTEDNTARLVVGAGSSGNRRNCFTTGNDGTDNYITIGNVKLTEAQLTQLLALLS